MQNTSHFSHDMAALFFELFLVERVLAKAFDSVYERHGITTKQWMVLAVIMNSERPTVSAIANDLHSSHQNIKAIALNLEKIGLIRLEQDPSDRRVTLLVPTPKLYDLEKLRGLSDQENMALVFSAYSEEELASFRAYCERLLQHVPTVLPNLT